MIYTHSSFIDLYALSQLFLVSFFRFVTLMAGFFHETEKMPGVTPETLDFGSGRTHSGAVYGGNRGTATYASQICNE